MKKLKILLGILVVLLVLLAVAAIVVGTHLGSIVKTGMEAVGPKVTQTTLTVDDVQVSLFAGQASIKGLLLGNPEGYTAPQSINVGSATVKLDPGSVLSDKIVIHSIAVLAPEITFEGNPLGDNNLKKIMANVNSLAAGASGATTNAPAAPTTPADKQAAKKLQVDDFLITGAKVHAKLTGLINTEITLPIPDIHLTALGTGPEGISPADLTKLVLREITTDTIKTLGTYATNFGKDAAGAAKNILKDAVNGGTNGLGQGVDKLKKGLGGLFGK